MDLGQRKVPEREADAPAQLLLDAFDRAECSTRIRALVVPVFDEQPRILRAADVIDGEIQRLDHRVRPGWFCRRLPMADP